MAHTWLQRATLTVVFTLAGTVHASAALLFVTEPFPPFNFEENGQVAGPMVEVLQAACKRAQITCNTRILPWRRALAMAESGHADGIFSILHGPEKAENFVLSDPVIRTAYSFFAPKDSGWTYSNPDSLQGMTLGVYGPSSTSITLSKLLSGQNTSQEKMEVSNFDALKTLSLGGYGPKAAVFINRDVGLFMTKNMHLTQIVPAGDVKHITYCFGMSKKSPHPDELAAFTMGLRKLLASGEVAHILAKHGVKGPPASK